MQEWIECNLPWALDNVFPTMEEYPNLDDKIRSVFGKTENEMWVSLFGEDHSRNEILSDFSNNKCLIEYEVGELNLSYSEAHDETLRRFNLIENFELISKFKEFTKSIKDWYYEQPEVINVIDKNDLVSAKFKEEQDRNSFYGKKLNKVGTLIEVLIDDKVSQFLIGDINQIRGTCDDCTLFDANTIVLRYKVIYTKE